MAHYAIHAGDTGDTAELLADLSIPTGTRRLTYTEFLDKSAMTSFLWFILIGCVVAQIMDGFDFESTSFALPLIIREFRVTPTQAGAIGSFTNIGLMAGALIFAPISDRFGRKPVLQWALAAYSFGTFLSAIAPNYQFLLAARFIAGLGIAAEFPATFALLAEYAPKRLRHVFVGSGSVAYSVGWFVSAIVATAIVPALGWRALFWVGVTPALVIIYVRRYIPESVRFLLRQGRTREAGEITRKLVDNAGFSDIELVPPEATAVASKPTLLNQFSTLRFYALTIFVIGLFHLCNNIQVVGFGTWLPSIFVRQGFTLTRSFTFTLIVLAVTPLGQFFGIWLQDKMPRQWALLLLSALSALCFFGFGLSFEYKYPIAVTVACDVGYQFFSGGVVPIVSTLSSELFPTRVRSLGFGLLSAISRIGSISGPLALGFFLTLGTEIHQIIYYFALPLFVAAVILVVFLRVDPRRKALEEITDGAKPA